MTYPGSRRSLATTRLIPARTTSGIAAYTKPDRETPFLGLTQAMPTVRRIRLTVRSHRINDSADRRATTRIASRTGQRDSTSNGTITTTRTGSAEAKEP
jgi:hypothetical protein